LNILVTGGAGFIATHLTRDLQARGHRVRAFDIEASREADESVTGDVRVPEDLAGAMDGIDLILHLAAEHRDDVMPRSAYYDVNVGGTRNLVQAAEAEGVRTIVFTSTVALYGLNRGQPDEKTAPAPFNDYGRSKLEAEALLAEWAGRGDGRRAVVVRPTVVFGEGNRGNVNTLIRQIDRGRFIFVGSGRNRKSLCYVGNFAPFLRWLSEKPSEAGVSVFNYADKPDLTVSELVHIIRGELGLEPSGGVRLPLAMGLAGGYAFDLAGKITGRKYPVSSIRVRKFCADTSVAAPALAETGFAAPFSLHEGLHRTISYMRSEGLLGHT
jgi:nucleoside-diphosphate-sugar epimerase